jgi:hypothetical protein
MKRYVLREADISVAHNTQCVNFCLIPPSSPTGNWHVGWQVSWLAWLPPTHWWRWNRNSSPCGAGSRTSGIGQYRPYVRVVRMLESCRSDDCRRHHNHGSLVYTPSLGIPAVSPTTTAVEHERLSSISVSTSNSTAILLDPSRADTKDKVIPSMTF